MRSFLIAAGSHLACCEGHYWRDHLSLFRGETLPVGFCVDDLLSFPGPGVYEIELSLLNGECVKKSIELLELAEVRAMSGSCGVLREPELPLRHGRGVATFAYRASWEQAEARDGRWLSRVNVRGGCSEAEEAQTKLSCTYERRVSVERLAVDWRWQAWTILRSGEDRSLVLWDLWRSWRRTLIPWTRETMVMDSFPPWEDGRAIWDVIVRVGKDEVLSTATIAERWDHETD